MLALRGRGAGHPAYGLRSATRRAAPASGCQLRGCRRLADGRPQPRLRRRHALLAGPGIGEAATRLLVEERRAGLLGIDTARIDHGQSTDFIARQVGAAAGVPNLENVADLSGLPPTGFLLVALPMNIEGGTGAPVRIVALIPPS